MKHLTESPLIPKSKQTMSLEVLHLTIPGTPIAQCRPRLGKHGVYDPQQAENQRIRMTLLAQCDAKGYKMKTGRLYLIDFKFYIPFPKATSKTILRDQEGELYFGTRDLDNFLKKYLDCMNKIVYADDRFVAAITASKHRSKDPRTEITVRWIEITSK